MTEWKMEHEIISPFWNRKYIHKRSFYLLLWILFIFHLAKIVLQKQLTTEHFSKINTSNSEIYILGDFINNLLSKEKYIFHQTNTQSMQLEVKNYFQCHILYDLEQLIKPPTQITSSKSSLIDHILTTFSRESFTTRDNWCGTFRSSTNILH